MLLEAQPARDSKPGLLHREVQGFMGTHRLHSSSFSGVSYLDLGFGVPYFNTFFLKGTIME